MKLNLEAHGSPLWSHILDQKNNWLLSYQNSQFTESISFKLGVVAFPPPLCSSLCSSFPASLPSYFKQLFIQLPHFKDEKVEASASGSYTPWLLSGLAQVC